jgi:hypothetical protein
MEIFNECSIIAAAYHLFLFTDYVEDPEMQYKIGWSIIGVTILNIIVNMIVMVWVSVRMMRLTFKRLYFKFYLSKQTKKSPIEK